MSGEGEISDLSFEIYEVQRIERREKVSFSNHFVQDFEPIIMTNPKYHLSVFQKDDITQIRYLQKICTSANDQGC